MGIKKSYFIFMKFLFLHILLFNVICFAVIEDEFVQDANASFVDEAHQAFSAKIKEWGVDIDDMVLGIYDYLEEDENETLRESNISTLSFEDMNGSSEEINASKVLTDISVALEDGNLSRKKAVSTVNINNTESGNKSKIVLIADKNTSISKIDENLTVQMDGNFTFDEMPAKDLEKRLKDKKTPVDDKVDEFFLTRKLLEERDRSYVRVSFLQPYNSLGPDKFSYNVKARVHLTRSRKRLKLFIENFNEDSARNIGNTGEDNTPSIGLAKDSKTFLGVRPRYSIGFRGIDPFVRARYTLETDFGRWHFKPVQSFQYSLKDEFSEITEIFLDRPTSEKTLLRFLVDRGTTTNDPGMHYDAFVQWFYQHRRHAGLSLNLGFNGSTKYENTIGSDPLLIERENRIFNYVYLMRWRENIWKKWFFYEIGPGINYHEMYDYRPNYNIYFGIDLFFGHI